MILLTVGSQLPFDRLVRAVDAWCAETGRNDVFGQIGNLGTDGYRPRNFEWSAFVPPSEFDSLLSRAQLIIAHAGMGSIISALRSSKPIVIMPRRAAMGEHRSDHQLATAARFAGRQGIYVADDETMLPATLQRATAGKSLNISISPYADQKLISSLRNYILNGTAVPRDKPKTAR